MSFSITKIDHVQMAAPKNEEASARRFYGDVLGLEEVEKPEPLKARGGVWFKFGAYELHVGVEDPFSPAKKAHPAFRVTGYEELQQQLNKHGISYKNDTSLIGITRMYADDPFGNRLEFIAEAKEF